MKLKVSDNQYLEYLYEMKPNNYMLGFAIKSQGLSNVINSSNDINLDWDLKGYRNEKSMRTENTMYSYYYYKSDDEVDYLNAGDTETVEDINWVSYQQKFFSSILLSEKKLKNALISSTELVQNVESDTVFTKKYTLKKPLELTNAALTYDMTWYYDITEYN